MYSTGTGNLNRGHSRWASMPFHQKDSACVASALSSQQGGRGPITLRVRRRLLSRGRPSLEIRFCGSVRYRGRKSRRKSRSPLTWNENNVKEPKKTTTTKQALETTHSSLSLSYLGMFRKIEPTRQRHRHKTTALRLCSSTTRRAWATNLSVCVFYVFFLFFS